MNHPLQGLTARAALLKTGSAGPEEPAQVVAPKQVRNLRAALGDQSELISTAQQQLSALEQQLKFVEEGQNSL